MGLFPRIAESQVTMLPEHPNGKVFYVNAQEGSNDNPGNRREKPFETIAYAISQCVNEENDVIFVTTPVQVEDQPIVVDKGAVQIIGLPRNTPLAQSGRCWIFPDGHVTGGVFTISESDVVIRNFMFWSTAGQPCIDFGGAHPTNVRNVIDQCSFHVGSYGVQSGAGVNLPSHYLTITNCMFHEQLSVGGIQLRSNGSWPLIADCFFETVPGPNIHITGGMAGGRILRCLFMLDSDTEGEAIHLGTPPTRWWIVDNLANDNTGAAITANPFKDDGADNAWCGNSKGGTKWEGIAPA